jgi:hypothetical protein
MAVRDLEAFMRTVAANYDSNMDTTPGSPFDVKIIQPLVRRLGIDPFTVDLQTFLITRLQQAYPTMATGEGDNITDLLIKPATLLWDPIVREIGRVERNLSFQDPTTLTNDEADSLGGNFFVPRELGTYSRGTGRLYFASPQQATVTQNNFVTSLGGLVYFPASVQSIRSQEMLLNIDSSGLYFFDVALIASSPGLAYDIDANQLTAVANFPAVVRVSNLSRFTGGLDEETPTDYAGRLNQSLGEKSLVTLRGIAAKLLDGFPNINRLNAVGFNDPEMQRDVLTGGGTGPILASGVAGATISDGSGKAQTARFSTSEANFDELVGDETNFVLTVFGASAYTTAAAVDYSIAQVIDQNTVDVTETSLILAKVNVAWTLRQRTLTLSNIPGGILFPNTPNGTLTIPDGEVHVGGAFDTYIREADFDDATFTLDSVVDDQPLLSGTSLLAIDNTGGGLAGTSIIELDDYTLNLNYLAGDEIDVLLGVAEYEGYALQIQDGPNSGTYRILEYFPATLATNEHPQLRIATALPVDSSIAVQWRLFADIYIDLVEPKETRVGGDDLVLTQGTAIVDTAGGIDFSAFGVSKGDTLRILDGPNKGDFTLVADPLVPSHDRLQIDRTAPFSSADTKYTIFRPETAGMQLPLVRIKTIEILDSTTQPQGSFVPYAKPVDIQSRSFQNPARGVKHDFRETRVGLVSAPADEFTQLFTVTLSTNTLVFYFGGLSVPIVNITLTAGTFTMTQMVQMLNSLIFTATGGVFADVVLSITNLLFGVRPVGNGFVAVVGGSAMNILFGGTDVRTTADIRTDAGDAAFGWWDSLVPAVDFETGLDVVQIVDGRNIGFYAGPFLSDATFTAYGYFPGSSLALMIGNDLSVIMAGGGTYFAPDSHRHVLIGARSIGSVRVYFLDPTTFEVNDETVFSLDTGATGIANFVPDPTMEYQSIPPLPNGTEPSDGSSTTGGSVFTSSGQDFLLSGINIGDTLYIDTQPLTGTLTHTDPTVSNLAGTTFVYNIDSGPDRTLIFLHDDPTTLPDQVTVASVIEQINASVGLNIASYDSSNRVTFQTNLPFVIRATGTCLQYLLGQVLGYTGPKNFSDSDTSNEAPHYLDIGYQVTAVSQTTLTVSPSFASVDSNWPSVATNETFRVTRSGVQRICTTEMSAQTAEAGLYYADIQLVSQGTGDFWNIDANQQMTAVGYKADGWYMITDDSNLTFSIVERPKLILSRSILEQGVDDDPRNATQLSGQSLSINYDRSSVVGDVQNFEMSETERVVCSSPLSRHLIPHFVRCDIEYFGGSTEDIVSSDIQKYMRNLYPVDGLDASELQQICGNRGATKVTNPITMLAIVHYVDRTIYAQRSQNTLSTGRLSAFIPDVLNITRNISGGSL